MRERERGDAQRGEWGENSSYLVDCIVARRRLVRSKKKSFSSFFMFSASL